MFFMFFEEAVEHLSEEKRTLLFETIGRSGVGFHGTVVDVEGWSRGAPV